MLTSRVYKPKDDEIIYHYCDANAFLSICSNKKIRFSDIFSMNDFFEMHWGYSIWEKAATELFNEVGRDFLDKIDEVIHKSGLYGLVITSCFSLDGDVLSQWRAYADDGTGYSIGFKAKDLIKLPIRPLKISYNEQEQINEVIKVVKALYNVENKEKEKYGSDFRMLCYELAYDLSAFKNPSFIEEKEIRLIHILDFEKSNDFLKLVDDGGEALGKEVKGEPVLFRIRDNIPSPYIDLDFINEGNINPVKEVIIGPKNNVLQSAISIFLETIGIEAVKIKHSRSSYR
ncbi:MAG TPA: DUF2971 domain-containing protein [Ignavibacteria bacterium]